jgi:hypothetical protein
MSVFLGPSESNPSNVTPMPFFADTNLCAKVPKNPSLQARWSKASEQFSRQGLEYAICPLVLLELLAGLAKPEPAYFKSDLKRFIFLANDGNAEFLPFPGSFALKTILSTNSPVARFSRADFEQWLKVMLLATTRDDLSSGRVDLYRSSLVSYGLDPAKVEEQQNTGKQQHIKIWERQRSDKRILNRNEWSALFLYGQGIIYKPDDLATVGEALDAAYEYDLALSSLPRDYNFRAAKNSGDWIDSQLLMYLCDPAMQMVTGDIRLKKRVAKSPQSSRIWYIEDF